MFDQLLELLSRFGPFLFLVTASWVAGYNIATRLHNRRLRQTQTDLHVEIEPEQVKIQGHPPTVIITGPQDSQQSSTIAQRLWEYTANSSVTVRK
jgi:hypothetical protein